MTPKEVYQKCFEEGKRNIKLENIISKDSSYSFYYALHIINGPWETGENVISSDPEWSYEYATIVIGGPFEKCHSIIFDSDYKNDYIIFLKSINYDLNKISEWLI